MDYLHREVAQRQGRNQSEVPCFLVPLGGVGEDMQKKSLFGTTAATDVKPGPGAFESARDRGLVFLDEIGQLAPGAQGDLLVPLQVVRSASGGECRRVTRMGSAEPIEARCFIAAATNLDLDGLVREGHFSEGLLQRFDGKRIVLPSLLERRTDIPLLVRHFVDRTCRRYGMSTSPRIDVPTAAWETYAAQHSVRQMENLIESALSANAFKKSLTAKDFALGDELPSESQQLGSATTAPDSSLLRELDVLRSQLAGAREELAQLRRQSNPDGSVARSVSALVELLSRWTPSPDSGTDEFDGAFKRLELAFGKAKLGLWRDLLARQKDLTGKATLMATAKRLLGRDDIHKSRPGDLANQVFSEAGITERPSDPILAEIWDKRRVSKK
jgi:DNA-binding NtrC family response regulator